MSRSFYITLIIAGFIGVDIFFVISGFLMTGIIFRGLENNNFNLSRFYCARINRIVPALLFMVTVIILLCFFCQDPLSNTTLSRSVSYTLSFISNAQYMRDAGYFDASAETKWLLHTWSLSVEWQFYLLYPIALTLLHRLFSLEHIKKLILIFTVGGFFWMLYLSNNDSVIAFYALHARFWQMLAGGLAYCYPVSCKPRQQQALVWLGIGSIVACCFLRNQDEQWPNLLALLPVLSAYSIIIATSDQNKLLTQPLLQWIGHRSYSLYLWHWPIVVAAHNFELPFAPYWGIPLSIVAACISYHFIEQTVRPTFSQWRDFKHVRTLWCLIPLIILSHLCRDYKKTLWLYSEDIQTQIIKIINTQKDWDYPKGTVPEQINGVAVNVIHKNAAKNILMIGCSHTEQTLPYVRSLPLEYNVYYLTQSGCPVAPTPDEKQCVNLHNYRQLLAAVPFEKIAMDGMCINMQFDTADEQAKQQRTQQYEQVFREFKAHANQVYYILVEPFHPMFNPAYDLHHSNKAESQLTVSAIRRDPLFQFQDHLLQELTELEGVTIIDPIKRLCPDGLCQTRTEQGRYFYRDSQHMRPWYVKSVGDLYLKEIFDSPSQERSPSKEQTPKQKNKVP